MDAKAGVLLGWFGGVAAVLLWAGRPAWIVLVSGIAVAVTLRGWLPKRR